MMTERVDDGAEVSRKAKGRVLDASHRAKATAHVLETYDATTLVGLRALVRGGAIERTDENGEVTVELPKMRELLASVAVARCLCPIRLRGWEMKAMRHIMKLTLAELAEKLEGRTAAETISRWENEAQPVGGYAEKVFRLLVCSELHEDALGIEYDGSMIAHLRVLDPWRMESDYEVPYIELELVRIKRASESIVEGWTMKEAA